MKREPKNERGGRGRGRKETFLPDPLPAVLLAPFFARSLTLVPRSLLLNRTETLATQASFSSVESTLTSADEATTGESTLGRNDHII